jgi:hypothetical protein
MLARKPPTFPCAAHCAHRAPTTSDALSRPPPRQWLARTLFAALAFALLTGLPARAEPPHTPPLQVQVNGRALDAAGQQALAALQTRIGPVPPGAYWYDVYTGAAGRWGGPTSVFLAPGLALGSALPAAASGGGDGRLTGVFINGRELHPVDVAGLSAFGPVLPGRYLWDAAGNVSLEYGRWLFNFNALRASRTQGAGTYHRSDAQSGRSTTVTGGCAAVSDRLRSSDSSSAYTVYVGCQ